MSLLRQQGKRKHVRSNHVFLSGVMTSLLVATVPVTSITGEPTIAPTASDTMFLGETAMTWAEANDYCAGLGRHLLSIHSNATQEEAMALCDSIDLTDSLGCWIGLYKDLTVG